MTRQVWVLAVLVAGSAAAIDASRSTLRRSPAEAAPRTGRERGQVEWLYYGGDQGGTKYSPLTDINAAERRSGCRSPGSGSTGRRRSTEYGTTPGFFESTPLMIDGVLYVTTPYNSIAALDAETGKELWRFDGEAYKLGPAAVRQRLEAARHRVLARRRQAARLPEQPASAVLARRRRPASRSARSATAASVSLTDGLPRISDITHATQSSPPVVYQDLVIVGSQVPDRVQLPDPVGYVQAFNARTGKRVWTFSVIPQSPKDPGAETWENESWRKNGHANVWAPMALDAARGLLYLPTSTPSSDYYGGEPAGREPVRRVAGLPRRRHRQDEVALSDRAPRPLGLRQPGAAEPGHDHRRTAGGSTPSRRSPSRASPTCSIA